MKPEQERKIENAFRKYKQRYIAKFGNVALDNIQIDQFCKSQFGTKYRGSFAQDSKITLKPGYYIFNTDIKTGPGEHWLAGCATKKTMYIFDSFARDPEKLVPILVNRIKAQKLKLVSSDRSDAEQRSMNRGKLVVNCGSQSLAWLTCVQEFGIRKAILI